MTVLVLPALLGPALLIADVGGVRGQPVHIVAIASIVAVLAVLLVVRTMLLARFAEAQADRARARARVAEDALRQQTSLRQQLTHQAFHDALTGLANRALFFERLEHALDRPAAAQDTVLLLVDLNRFKDVNDSLGHPVGDELLITVGHRLLGAARRNDTVARMGGDEFAILAEDLREIPAETYAQRFLDRFQEPFALSGHHSVFITASIGVVALTEPTTFHDALRGADIALYAAKERGRNRAQIFEPAMSQAQQDHARIAQDLRHALPRDELSVHYQPVIHLPTGQVTGVEALLRWQRDGRPPPIPPEVFVPVAEETGLIRPIGAWVLREACRHGQHWHDTLPGGEALSVAVNVSGWQLKDHRFPDTVRQVLRETGFSPASLVLEITESTLVTDADTTSPHIRALRDLGVRISIDDFGTGYSSLAYLRDLPADIVKIDQSFVLRGGSEANKSLIQAILHIGHALDVIAEGIETPHQAQRLHTRLPPRPRLLLLPTPGPHSTRGLPHHPSDPQTLSITQVTRTSRLSSRLSRNNAPQEIPLIHQLDGSVEAEYRVWGPEHVRSVDYDQVVTEKLERSPQAVVREVLGDRRPSGWVLAKLRDGRGPARSVLHAQDCEEPAAGAPLLDVDRAWSRQSIRAPGCARCAEPPRS
ncbi:EAL domain-containing protein [Streptomyces olindensis]|uniref:EAL domain-containing protein n=1 Tax=Streptomyces olindensis TaxID=358823 RepID=UPI003647D99E